MLREQLRRATRECAARGLNCAAKWSAELLNALPPPVASTSQLPPPPTSSSGAGRTNSYSTSTPARTNSNANNNDSNRPRGSLPNLPNVASIARHSGYGRESLGSVSGFSPAHGFHFGIPEERPGKDEGMEEDQQESPERVWKEEQEKLDEAESDLYELALSYERVHEHHRAANCLAKCVGPKARWLRSYTKFLVRFPPDSDAGVESDFRFRRRGRRE